MLAALNDLLPVVDPIEEDWRDLAACAVGDGSLAQLFFSEEL